MIDLPADRPYCGNCKSFELPPRNVWPNSAFGACMDDRNVCIGPEGWNSGAARPAVSNLCSCTHFDRRIQSAEPIEEING